MRNPSNIDFSHPKVISKDITKSGVTDTQYSSYDSPRLVRINGQFCIYKRNYMGGVDVLD